MMTSPRDLPQLQGEQVGWLLSPEAHDHFERLMGWGDAAIATRRFANIIRQASLYWVAPNMTRLAMNAGQRLDNFPLRAEDIPSVFGMLYYQQPITGMVDTPDLELAPINVVTWKIHDDRVQIQLWTTGDLWISEAHKSLTNYRAEVFKMIGPMVCVYQSNLPFDAPILIDPATQTLHGIENPDAEGVSTATDVMVSAHRTILATWLLMQDTIIAEYDDQQTPRATAKRFGRMGIELPKTIRAVELRKHETVGAPRPGSAGEKRYDRYQWWVKGHWRQQYYPSEGRHKPRWIQGYRKGDPTAPFKDDLPVVNVLKR